MEDPVAIRIWPLHFQAGGRKRRPNVALVFVCVYFVLYRSSFVFRMNVCFCCAKFSFCSSSKEIGCKERLRNDLFCVEWDVKP